MGGGMDSVMRGMQQAYTEVTQHLGDAGKVGRLHMNPKRQKLKLWGTRLRPPKKQK